MFSTSPDHEAEAEVLYYKGTFYLVYIFNHLTTLTTLITFYCRKKKREFIFPYATMIIKYIMFFRTILPGEADFPEVFKRKDQPQLMLRIVSNKEK